MRETDRHFFVSVGRITTVTHSLCLFFLGETKAVLDMHSEATWEKPRKRDEAKCYEAVHGSEKGKRHTEAYAYDCASEDVDLCAYDLLGDNSGFTSLVFAGLHFMPTKSSRFRCIVRLASDTRIRNFRLYHTFENNALMRASQRCLSYISWVILSYLQHLRTSNHYRMDLRTTYLDSTRIQRSILLRFLVQLPH